MDWLGRVSLEDQHGSGRWKSTHKFFSRLAGLQNAWMINSSGNGCASVRGVRDNTPTLSAIKTSPADKPTLLNWQKMGVKNLSGPVLAELFFFIILSPENLMIFNGLDQGNE